MPVDLPTNTHPFHRSSRDYLTLVALGFGMAVPFIYYGIQIVAAPFLPGYSFLTEAASALGSDRSTNPAVFNVGVMATGLATLVASLGFFRALRRVHTRGVLVWITTAALVGSAFSSLWAGIFPLPDPRHGGHPALLIAVLLLPFLLTASLWKQREARLLKAYLVATLVLPIAMVPLMSGMTGLDTGSFRGLLQRIFALAVFPPIAVCAYFLARRGAENSAGSADTPTAGAT